MQIVQEEVFGSVLSVIEFGKFEEAIELANVSKYGLTSSIYTNNLPKAFKVVDYLEFREPYINRENLEAIQGCHTGSKHSGFGGADGKHDLEEYLRTYILNNLWIK